MSWQFVFKHVSFTFSCMEHAALYAFNGGYRFFEWNGEVYFIVITPEVQCIETGIKSGDLV